jgi:type VI secretion system protein VasD
MSRGALPLLRAAVCAAALTVACAKASPPAAPAAPAPAPAPAPALTIAAPSDAPTSTPMTLLVAADVNPNASGRPSPIVVRVYQLRTDGRFGAAEFEPLYADDRAALGEELISRDEFVLEPAEKRVVNVDVAAATRYVGVVAAYRDIRNAQWRGLLEAPRKGFTVAVERTRVQVSVP